MLSEDYRELRRVVKLTQRELAENLGCSRDAIASRRVIDALFGRANLNW